MLRHQETLRTAGASEVKVASQSQAAQEKARWQDVHSPALPSHTHAGLMSGLTLLDSVCRMDADLGRRMLLECIGCFDSGAVFARREPHGCVPLDVQL